MNHHLFYKMKNNTGICLTMSNGNAFEIDPNFDPLLTDSTSGSPEKHIPIFKNREDKIHVRIGEKPHPSLPEHHIEWIYVETTCGGMIHYLNPIEPPKATFNVTLNEVVCVYAYFNIHGLWKNGKPNYKNNGLHDIKDEIVCSPEFPESCTESWDDINENSN